MDRRTLLKTGSLAALGLGFGGCAARNGVAVAPSTQFVKLPPVRASWDRVIRTTVGLRPHRPSGFVLRLRNLVPRRSFTTTGTAAQAIHLRGAPARWPLT